MEIHIYIYIFIGNKSWLNWFVYGLLTYTYAYIHAHIYLTICITRSNIYRYMMHLISTWKNPINIDVRQQTPQSSSLALTMMIPWYFSRYFPTYERSTSREGYGNFNPLHAIFHTKLRCMSAVYIIPPYWHAQVVETLPHVRQELLYHIYIFYIVNIMGADVLVTQEARALATLILTMFNRNNSVPAR